MKPFIIRWRKSSASWVIYDGRKVFESGFGSEADAVDFLLSYEKGKYAARIPGPALAAAPEYLREYAKELANARGAAILSPR